MFLFPSFVFNPFMSVMTKGTILVGVQTSQDEIDRLEIKNQLTVLPQQIQAVFNIFRPANVFG
jgi:hypothetical protein